MVRDENWFDAVGKDDWRQEQIERREKAMNKTQEALKLCLRVLKPIAEDRIYETRWLQDAIDAAQKALESHERRTPKNCTPLDEFIAELEKEPEFKKIMDEQRVLFNEIKEGFDALRQEQEPVAYIKEVGGYGIIDFAHIDEDGAYPVYTHPAQPLSDDEIRALIVKYVSVDCTCDPYEFARAIEKAHGIGK